MTSPTQQVVTMDTSCQNNPESVSLDGIHHQSGYYYILFFTLWFFSFFFINAYKKAFQCFSLLLVLVFRIHLTYTKGCAKHTYKMSLQ